MVSVKSDFLITIWRKLSSPEIMGVLRFFRHIALGHPECLINLKCKTKADLVTCETAASKGIVTDWLELDLNSIYHPVAQELYQYGVKPQTKNLLRNRGSRNNVQPPARPQPSEETLFKAICHRIELMRKVISPRKGIYFATDGVAGVSKQSQQRKRRFLGVLSAKQSATPSLTSQSSLSPPKFDSNCISCGTPFMERLGKYIDTWIQTQLASNPEWGGLEILVSNDRVSGEGEHKILRHMRANPQWSYTIVSPDADLIFLGMGSHNPNVYIFRECIFDDIDADYFLVDISRFKQSVLTEIGMEAETNDIKIRAIIEDFIVYCTFIGNDFIPTIPSLNIAQDGIEILFMIYSKIVKEHGFISMMGKNGQYTIRKQGLKAFLGEMAKQEYGMIWKSQRFSKAKWPDTIMKECISYPPVMGKFRPSGQVERIMTIDLPRYKEEYYKKKFNGVDPKVVVHEYLKGMLFVLRYYLVGIPSWTYSFPFHYGVFFSEIYEHIDQFDVDYEFPPSIALSPLEQLVSILPGKNSDLLPEPLRMLSTSSESPIIDMYPVDFQIDLEGKKNDYEGVVLLPSASDERVHQAFEALEHLLDEVDRARNRPGCILEYSRNSGEKVSIVQIL